MWGCVNCEHLKALQSTWARGRDEVSGKGRHEAGGGASKEEAGDVDVFFLSADLFQIVAQEQSVVDLAHQP